MKTNYKASGQWAERYPYSKEGYWIINCSDILTQLIQSCGKYCKRYASDLFIDWKCVTDRLERGEPINDSYIFAIRDYGVDHKSFYEARDKDTMYHEVWELTITTEDDGKWMDMELNLIAN